MTVARSLGPAGTRGGGATARGTRTELRAAEATMEHFRKSIVFAANKARTIDLRISIKKGINILKDRPSHFLFRLTLSQRPLPLLRLTQSVLLSPVCGDAFAAFCTAFYIASAPRSSLSRLELMYGHLHDVINFIYCNHTHTHKHGTRLDQFVIRCHPKSLF